MPIVNLPPEPTGYAATAEVLRLVADDLDTLPPTDEPPYVQLSILPKLKTAEEVDAVALAVTGKRGQTMKVGAAWTHIAHGGAPARNFQVTIQAPVPDDRDVEIERLRAELAEALVRAMPVPHGPAPGRYMREVDNGDAATPVPATVDGHPEFTGRAAVPDMPQTKQCSPECVQSWPKFGGEGVHLPGCPNGGE